MSSTEAKRTDFKIQLSSFVVKIVVAIRTGMVMESAGRMLPVGLKNLLFRASEEIIFVVSPK